jgi:hypothetical protein
MYGKWDCCDCSILNNMLTKSMKFSILKADSSECIPYSDCGVTLLKHTQWNVMAAKEGINIWALFITLRSTHCKQHRVQD